jgi:hypothetical protein
VLVKDLAVDVGITKKISKNFLTALNIIVIPATTSTGTAIAEVNTTAVVMNAKTCK